MPSPFESHPWMAVPVFVFVFVVVVPYGCFLAWDTCGRLDKVNLWKGEMTFHSRKPKSQSRDSKKRKIK